MIRLAWLGALLILATAATAQTVPVRSGEHGSFTRLVFRLPAGAEWSLTQNDRTAEILVNDPDIVFQTSPVFRRINRARLAEVSQSAPGQPLELDLACDCQVKALVESGRYLVLDISARDTSENAVRSLPPISLGTQLKYRFSSAPRNAAEQTEDRNTVEPEARPLPQAAEINLDDEPGLPLDDPFLTDAEAIAQRLTNVNLSEKRLLRQIGRAASQGLLDPNNATANSNGNTRSARAEGSASVTDRPMPDNRQGPQVSLSAASTIDRDAIARIASMAGLGQSETCIPADGLDIANWGDGRPFSLQIGDIRASLYGEFDRVDADKALQLAKTYLHFGFGAEARQALTLLSKPDPNSQTLLSLADILDETTHENYPVFASQTHCDGPAAMWAMLSLTDFVSLDAGQRQSVLQSFWALPPHLRGQLGPRLSRVFALLGDDESAGLVLRSVDRAAPDVDNRLPLARADIAELKGDAEQADEILAETAQSGSDAALEALIRQVDRAFDDRDTLASETPATIVAHLTEYRNSSEGPALRKSLAIAHALVGAFDDASLALEVIRETDGAGAANAAKTAVLWLASERSSDMELVKVAHPSVERDQIPQDIALQTKLAERFVALSLPDMADPFLRDPAYGKLETQRRLLRARIAMMRDEPGKALLELVGENGDEATSIRAKAHARLKDHAAAATYFSAVSNQNSADRELWLSGNEEPADNQDQSSGYAQVSAGIAQITQTPEANTAPGPLGHSQALLDNSAQARRAISEMLDFASTPRTASGS